MHGRIRFVSSNFQENLNNTRHMSSQLCMLVISDNHVHNSVIDLINRPGIQQEIHRGYVVIGCLKNDPQLKIIPTPIEPPEIIICRLNVFEEVVILGRFVGDEAIESITTDKLHEYAHESRNLHRRDINVIIKYRNYISRRYYGHNYYDEDEEEEISLVDNRRISEEIQHQNQEYQEYSQQVQIEEKMKQEQRSKEEEKQRIIEELIEERKIRKITIPNEPTEGNIIRINFRCPDGSMKVRNFNAKDKLEMVYSWVETNEEIDFEDNLKREFQLLHSFPPVTLCDKKEQELQQVFDTDQEKIIIKEL